MTWYLTKSVLKLSWVVQTFKFSNFMLPFQGENSNRYHAFVDLIRKSTGVSGILNICRTKQCCKVSELASRIPCNLSNWEFLI